MKTSQTTLYRALTVALLGCAAGSAGAQDATVDSQLQPVTVISTVENLTDSSSIIDESQLNHNPSNNAGVLFDHMAGVEFEKSAVGGLGDIRIRGMGGAGSGDGTGQNRVAVNVDGVALPDTFSYGHITRNNRTTFDTADLKKVEVIKGANPAGNGHSGIAGTVNFTTKDPVDYLQDNNRFGGNVRAGYNSQDNNFAVGATLAGQFSDNVSGMVSLTHRQFDELKNEGGVDVIGSERTANNPVDGDSNNVLAKLVFNPNEQHELKLKVEHFKQDYDSTPLNVGRERYDNVTTKRNFLSLRHNFNRVTPLFDSGHWQAYYQKNSQTRNMNPAFYMPPYLDAKGKTAYDVKNIGVEVGLNKAIGEHNINYGLGYEKTDTAVEWNTDGLMDAPFQPDTTVTQANAFVSADFSLMNDALHLLPSVQVVHYEVDADERTDKYDAVNSPTTDLSDTKLSWKLGAAYHLDNENKLFASYHSGLRSPSFAELNSDIFHNKQFGARSLPNPNLKPEEVAGFEIGVSNHSDWGSHTLSAFHDNYKNIIYKEGRIDCRPGPRGEVCNNMKMNSNSPVVVYGAEYQGTLNLAQLGMPAGAKLKTSLSYTKGKNKNNDQPYSPINPFNGYVGLAYDEPNDVWGGELGVRFAAKKSASQIDDNDLKASRSPLKPLGGYGVVDLSAYYNVGKNLHINAGVYNLFDKEYATWADYQNSDSRNYEKATSAGRSFAVSAQYDF
ncbi:MAG: hypothetical protein CR974_00330 [Gammaproteobacteria bacterium]|nr:MAG: hypothetical protein CR974_00330 [Gammaproteobacteria bacterium]